MLKLQGMTLVELLIATALGALVLSLSTNHIAFLHHSFQKMNRQIALKDEMRMLQQLLTVQLQQANFVMRTYPALPETSELKSSVAISQFDGELPNSCITFTTDKDHSGDIELTGAEFVGFRLRDNAIEQSVSGALCDKKGWHDITDANTTTVESFNVSPLSLTSLGAVFAVNINASCKKDSTIKHTLSFMVTALNVRA